MSKRTASKPLKMWIDGGCFNIRPYDITKRQMAKPSSQNDESLQVLENKYIINTADNGKLTTKFRLPSQYYNRLSNFPQFSAKMLGQVTQTEIAIPEYGKTGYLTISGESEPNVINAREAIHSVLGEIREKQFIQQFIAIPVVSDEIKTNFEKFKEEILSEKIEGIHTSIFQSSAKLHLTLAVFSLLDEAEKNEAITALNDCKSQILEPILKGFEGPIKIKVAGIECMNDDISKVNILYAKASIENDKEENILQKVADDVSSYFYDRGLIRQYQEKVKLHVTLINTKYRKLPNNDISYKKRSKWYYRKQPFDARTIIEKYKNHYFGETILNSFHLSNVVSVGEDGFYKPLSVVSV